MHLRGTKTLENLDQDSHAATRREMAIEDTFETFEGATCDDQTIAAAIFGSLAHSAAARQTLTDDLNHVIRHRPGLLPVPHDVENAGGVARETNLGLLAIQPSEEVAGEVWLEHGRFAVLSVDRLLGEVDVDAGAGQKLGRERFVPGLRPKCIPLLHGMCPIVRVDVVVSRPRREPPAPRETVCGIKDCKRERGDATTVLRLISRSISEQSRSPLNDRESTDRIDEPAVVACEV